MKGRKVTTLVTAVLLMLLFALPGTVYAEKTITGLGTGSISDPVPGTDNPNQPWVGSYVYYGIYISEYNGEEIGYKYRVLATNTSDFGGKTMLLECDSGFFQRFNFGFTAKLWSDSDLKRWLNEVFINLFTTAEQSAMVENYKNGKVIGDGNGGADLQYTPLAGEKIFVLDAVEATRSSYGYSTNPEGGAGNGRRKKVASNFGWWLRSLYDIDTVGVVYPDGSLGKDAFFVDYYCSPAFNVDLSSILFSTDISTESEPRTYKLTLKDTNLGVSAGTITRDGNKITVNNCSTSGGANRISVLMTYKADDNSPEELKYYGELSSTGTFDLPNDYQDSWTTYILAEQVNGGRKTDYGSEPLTIKIPHIDHDWSYSASGARITAKCNGEGHCGIKDGLTLTISAPKDLTYDGKPKAATLSTGFDTTAFPDSPYTIVYEKDGKTVSADDVTNAGKYTAKVTAGNATAKVDFTITKAEQEAPSAPSATKVTSTSIQLKKLENGEYKCGSGSWQSQRTFSGLKAGKTYTFYQRVKGDENHKASPNTSSKISTLKTYTITFDTKGGSSVKAITKDYGASIKAPADPTKKGYIFNGWDPAIPKTMPAKNMTIKAKWKTDTTPDPVDPNKRNYFLFQIRQKKVTKSSVSFTWNKISGATSYVIYGSICDTTLGMKKLDTVNKTSWTYKNLKKGTYYRFYVVAKKGKKKLATSDVIHMTTTGGSYGNPVEVSAPKSVSVKVNKTRQLNTSVTNNGTVDVHKTSELSYESTNPKIAKVSRTGKVTAVAEGTCYVYVFAQNGISARVKVVVKK